MTDGITRRDFIKLSAAGAAAAAVLAGCEQPRRWITLEPYVTPPEEQLAGVATWYASTCRQCPAGCGIIVRIMNGRAKKIEGNPEHPLNQGKLCARGQSSLQILYSPDRLQGAVRQTQRGTRSYQSISWEEALNTLYAKLDAAGSGLAIWGGAIMSGHLYQIFQQFSAAVGAPAPLIFDLYTAYHGYQALDSTGQTLLGKAGLPAYDLSQADVVFSFGADLFGTWLSATRYGIEYGNFRRQTLGKRGYLVQFEPRMSITGAKSDQWVPLRPGTEAQVAQAIARIIADQSFGPSERVQRAKALAGTVDVNAVAQASDVSVDVLTNLARTFATSDRVVAIPGSALAGQPGSDAAVTAVQMLNVIAGSVGQLGGVSLSAPAPDKPALGQPKPSTYADAQSLIAKMKNGEVKALLVYGANPAYELPANSGFVDALRNVPFVVSFAPIVDETAVWADLIMPERTALEAWGYAVVSPNFGTPIVSSQQPVVTPVTDSRSTADVMLTVARGIPAAAKALSFTDEVEYLKGIVNQLPPGVGGGNSIDEKWARFLQHGGWWPTSAAAALQPASTPTQAVQAPPAQYQGDEGAYPFFLHIYMSGLLSDGRGASQPWLQGSPDPLSTVSWQTWVELHPSTAQKLGLQDGDVVKVTSPYGEIEAAIYTYPGVRPDTVAIPLGQGHTDLGRYARNRGSNPIQLAGSQPGDANLNWSTLRVQLSATGKNVAVAHFEDKVGVTQGFINQAFPGQ